MIERFEQNVSAVPKGRMKHPDVKDFKRLNKVVLKEGATNASANYHMRVNHDLKIVKQTAKLGGPRLPANLVQSDSSYGRPNRPQTPVNGIIHGQFENESEMEMQVRYANWKQTRATSKGPINIRMTNA